MSACVSVVSLRGPHFVRVCVCVCVCVADGEVQSFPVGKVDNVIDTNGAGDAFVGGECPTCDRMERGVFRVMRRL